jgi:aminopeptidase N
VKTAKKPVVIATQDEAIAREKSRATGTKTWVYYAQNVRDFAWTSSRKFIWDAMGVNIGGRTVMAMSYYPKEGNPLWGQYSTEVVAHTLRVYSKYTIDYPYPVAISVDAENGMEYPMICFNYGRPEKDGTYSERIKYGMISVIIHEVGHNFFPMIINSDERQWTWMDEGLNTFLQYLAEQEWERNYPSRRGPARYITDYMKSDPNTLEPIMTNSESIQNLGANAYGKAATGLNIMRETIMGRELFDYAFKEYARRWAFKHPTPADFFRTMEDASGIDLDWFIRGWFYTTDYCDISIENVIEAVPSTGNPEIEKPLAKAKAIGGEREDIGIIRNRTEIKQTATEMNPALNDFYNSYDPFAATKTDKENYQRYLATLGDEEKKMIESKNFFYQIDFKNYGELVMPIIVEFEFEDGSRELHRIPAEIWRKNDKEVSKIFKTEKRIKQIYLDPFQETADINMENNFFPRKSQLSRFEIFKQRQIGRGTSTGGENPMQRARRENSTTPNGGKE